MINRSSLAFVRSYVVVAAGILIIALALDSLLVWMLPADEQLNENRYASHMAMLELLLFETDADVSLRFNTLKPQLEIVLGFPVTLYELADVRDQQVFLDELNDGGIKTFRDAQGRELLYQLLPATGYIIALGPLADEPRSADFLETSIIISYYLLVALFLFLWIRPFYRDLMTLRAAASQFGRDDFDTRVSVSEKSSILPVAQSFNRMAERIKYLVTAHRDLTNAVAHELRTPLARFKFSLQMIPDIHDESRQTTHLDAMKLDVQELETLIDEMLSYARLSEDNLQLAFETVPVAQWLERQLLQYTDSDISVRLQLDAEIMSSEVHFNADLMARALHNVLRNCLRYAKTEVQVTFSLEGRMVLIRISDDGPGVPESFHQTIFEPFARLDTSRDRQSGGYGLGLAIARRILQRHGGDISVKNRQVSGACFVLHWPYN